MNGEFDYSDVALYRPPPDAAEALLVDLDGTVCLREKGGRGPYDEERVGEDLVNVPVVRAVKALREQEHLKVIGLSGRKESCRRQSEAWLGLHVPGLFDELYMRAVGDTRKDWMVKAEIFDLHIRNRFRIFGVFDDREQVVKMWRAIGLTVFQVAEGKI